MAARWGEGAGRKREGGSLRPAVRRQWTFAGLNKGERGWGVAYTCAGATPYRPRYSARLYDQPVTKHRAHIPRRG